MYVGMGKQRAGKGSKKGRKERGLLNVVCLNVACEKLLKKKKTTHAQVEGRTEGTEDKERTKRERTKPFSGEKAKKARVC